MILREQCGAAVCLLQIGWWAMVATSGNVLGSVGVIMSIANAIATIYFMMRQTRAMESTVDKAVEVKITRDLEAPGSEIDSKLRAYLNRRLGDVRTQLRQELQPQIDEISNILDQKHIRDGRDIAAESISVLYDQKDAIEIVKASNGKLSALENEIRELQQAMDDIKNGVGNQAMVRTQIRGIAEQLLKMTMQE